jgi:hypothetical protein
MPLLTLGQAVAAKVRLSGARLAIIGSSQTPRRWRNSTAPLSTL